MIRIRCSSLGEIMGNAKSIDAEYLTDEIATISRKKIKTDEEKALIKELLDKSLSSGAKTHAYKLAKEFAMGYRKVVYSKPMDKGTRCEQDSIDLLNCVWFTDYQKNIVRDNNDFLTGECDIDTGEMIIDIKSSWDLDTFPATSEAAHDSGYEWQLRGYMLLRNRDKAKLVFCLVDTPEDLINYEQEDLHYVSERTPESRITVVTYARDLELEALIEIKCKAAIKEVLRVIKQIEIEHNY